MHLYATKVHSAEKPCEPIFNTGEEKSLLHHVVNGNVYMQINIPNRNESDKLQSNYPIQIRTIF